MDTARHDEKHRQRCKREAHEKVSKAKTSERERKSVAQSSCVGALGALASRWLRGGEDAECDLLKDGRFDALGSVARHGVIVTRIRCRLAARLSGEAI